MGKHNVKTVKHRPYNYLTEKKKQLNVNKECEASLMKELRIDTWSVQKLFYRMETLKSLGPVKTKKVVDAMCKKT